MSSGSKKTGGLRIREKQAESAKELNDEIPF